MHIEYVFRSTQHNCFPGRQNKDHTNQKCKVNVKKKRRSTKAKQPYPKSGSFEHCTHILTQNCSCSNQHNHQPAAFSDKLVGALSVLQFHNFTHHTSNTFTVGGNQAASLIDVNMSHVFGMSTHYSF